MGLIGRTVGFVGRAAGRKLVQRLDAYAESPEGRAALERVERMMDLVGVARQIAGTGFDDDRACTELRGSLPEDRSVSREAIEHLGALRTSYIEDRAYRLLTAAVDGTAVRPIDARVREQFLAEAELGRLSLAAAFARLCALEPRLNAGVARASSEHPPKDGFSRARSEPQLVGVLAKSPHAVVTTDLAASVVREYGIALRRGAPPERDPIPFFQRKKLSSSRSFAVFGRDKRPRAAN